MPRLPALKAQQIIRALKKAGLVEDRQKGSHLMMRHPETNALTVIPVHARRTLKRPLVRSILKDANISEAETPGVSITASLSGLFVGLCLFAGEQHLEQCSNARAAFFDFIEQPRRAVASV